MTLLADQTSLPDDGSEAAEKAVPARVEFQTSPEQYRHWLLSFDGPVATLTLKVDEQGGLVPGYELKMNSYDLGVDIELYDAVQRLRFEHPEVKAVVVTGGMDRMFCAGANIRMLAQSSHAWKVNFCKFTNETRNGIEDATAHSGQTYLAALNGTAAGGGYELALACEQIVLVDDGSSAVSLPEVPLLGVLPGTGGLTRVVDKRHVRKDRADVFATRTEGARGATAVEWGLIDETVPLSRFADTVRTRAEAAVAGSTRTGEGGIVLTPLAPVEQGNTLRYRHVEARLDRAARRVDILVHGPEAAPPADAAAAHAQGVDYYPLALARELDHLVLHLRTNELQLGTWVLRTRGDAQRVLAYDAQLDESAGDWFLDEVRHYLKRTFKRLDVTSRSLFAVIEPGSCFAGSLLELALACDRQYMLDGVPEEELAGIDPAAGAATIAVGPANAGLFPMGNGLTRLQSRFYGRDGEIEEVLARTGEPLDAAAAMQLGLVTLAPDDLDWEEELRIALEERAALSPDALTGMEANHRFVGPETVETKVFGRLTAWQNWIFLRPNASGPEGALRRFGSGTRADYDTARV
ncbi:MAG: 2,3-epoxybenzoyl-CoA dihydrolase [Mycobacteriales bacterium]